MVELTTDECEALTSEMVSSHARSQSRPHLTHETVPSTVCTITKRCFLAVVALVLAAAAFTSVARGPEPLSPLEVGGSPLPSILPHAPSFPNSPSFAAHSRHTVPPPPPPSRAPSDELILELGTRALPVLGEGQRWRRDDEYGIFFNQRNAALKSIAPSYDTACGTIIVDLPDAETTSYHIVELAPYFSTVGPRYGNISIVHHMDLFLCDERVRVPPDSQCMGCGYLSTQGPCYAMVWAYDRGAFEPFRLPSDAGMRVGRGTRFTKLLLFVHYGLPYRGVTASQLRDAAYVESSGVSVRLVRTPRPLDAFSFEFMQTNMNIPPASNNLEFVSHMTADGVASMLGTDIAAGGGAVSLRMVHAHAHYHATRVSLHRIRQGQWTTLLELNPYCGYGECQHFHNLTEPRIPAASGAGADEAPTGAGASRAGVGSGGGSSPALRLGDALEFRCLYDNPEPFALHYGLSSGMEMCGAILVYTPHVWQSARQVPTWFGGHDGVQRLVHADGVVRVPDERPELHYDDEVPE